jgi:predicted RNase H-like HicB family nuclease
MADRVQEIELAGLHTQGDDLHDAMANANEAVALCIEGSSLVGA